MKARLATQRDKLLACMHLNVQCHVIQLAHHIAYSYGVVNLPACIWNDRCDVICLHDTCTSHVHVLYMYGGLHVHPLTVTYTCIAVPKMVFSVLDLDSTIWSYIETWS